MIQISHIVNQQSYFAPYFKTVYFNKNMKLSAKDLSIERSKSTEYRYGGKKQDMIAVKLDITLISKRYNY
mgnify:CR=1 FL=1